MAEFSHQQVNVIRQDAVSEKIEVFQLTARLDGLAKNSRPFWRDEKTPSILDVYGHKVDIVPINGALSHWFRRATVLSLPDYRKTFQLSNNSRNPRFSKPGVLISSVLLPTQLFRS